MDMNHERVSTISGINRLPQAEKRAMYRQLIPDVLIHRFQLSHTLLDAEGRDLIKLNAEPDHPVTEMSLYHQVGFEDPIFYGHITDTLNGQIHILLYILNDPDSPRYDVDRMPDGTPTQLGSEIRNLEAETAAMRAGLAPGQIRKGLRMRRYAIQSFDQFVEMLGHPMYFAEPLYYHNAIIFERYGFFYEKGRKLMETIQEGFAPGGELRKKLDGSSPFRKPEAAGSIRLRSWAIHDGIMGQPFSEVTMYKRVGVTGEISTCPGCEW